MLLSVVTKLWVDIYLDCQISGFLLTITDKKGRLDEVPETLKTNVFLVQTGQTLIQAPSDKRN